MPAMADGLRRNMRSASTVGCSTFGTGLACGVVIAAVLGVVATGAVMVAVLFMRP